jgi:hypothetical protein
MHLARQPNNPLDGPVSAHPWRHLAGKLLILLGFIAVYALMLASPMSDKADAQLALLALAVIALGTQLL